MTLEKLWESVSDKMTSAGMKLLWAMVVLIVGLVLIRWLKRALARSKAMAKVDQSARSFLRSLINVILYVLLFLTIASILGIPMTSFVTILASASVAIGLALQGALANFVGGLMILLVHPFRVGDFIETVDHSGTVRSITVFYTILSTIDNKQITIPNGSLTNAAIVNYSAAENRRVDMMFSVGYESDIEQVKGILLELAETHELALRDPAPMARLSQQNASSLDFVLRVWCKAENYWTLYYDLNEAVKKRLDAAGISIPYPQMDVHVK